MFEKIEHLENADLSQFSTIKIGGVAKFIVFPKNVDELLAVLKTIDEQNLKYFVLGNGSNVLFDDEGYDGVIISLKHFCYVERQGESVVVGAGINLFALNHTLKNMALSGLEWSYGIPATLGGLVFMNGGCFGHEISEFVEEILILDKKPKWHKREEFEFSYRHSGIEGVILKVKLKLFEEKSEKIEEKMQKNYDFKRQNQDYEFPSLGSVFKRVQKDGEMLYPAKNIDNLGLKGVRIGGVEVSKKHAGFFVNVGGGTAKDFLKLLTFVSEKLRQSGVEPETEIIFLKK